MGRSRHAMKPSATPPPRRRRNPAVARIDILDAAEARFATEGFHATRLEDIGADIGMSRAAVLFHFSDKVALYRDVLDDVFGGLLGDLQFALAGTTSVDLRLRVALTTAVDYAGRRPSAAHLTMREAATTDAVLRDVAQKQAKPLLKLLGVLLREGARTGRWQPRCDVYHFASIIGGAIALYVGAARTLVADLPYDPLSATQLAALKDEVLIIAAALLRPAASSALAPEDE